MAYLVLRGLWLKGGKTVPAGTQSGLPGLSQASIDRLVEVGAVRAIASPPLAELAGWKIRAAKLEAMEIRTVEDFLRADPSQIAEFMGTRPTTVGRWRTQLEEWTGSGGPTKSG